MVAIADILSKDEVLANRWAVAKNNAHQWLKALDKNGFSHSESIERYLNQLLTDDAKDDMNPAEVFVLLFATYLHDIGRLTSAEKHEFNSYQHIINNCTKYGLNNFEARAIAEVAYAHAPETEKPINSLNRQYGVDTLSKYHTIDLQFLGALLRIADEIDNAFTRVIEIPNQSLSVRNLINYVHVDNLRWKIEYQHCIEYNEDKDQLIPLLQNANKKLLEVMNIFERRNLFYWCVVADPDLERTNLKSYAEVRAKYLKRLTDCYRYIDFRGILQIKKIVRIKLQDVYVPLRTVPYEQIVLETNKIEKNGLADKEKIVGKEIKQVTQDIKKAQKMKVGDVLKDSHIVLLGNPGSGKTTLAKYLALIAAKGDNIYEGGSDKRWLPIVMPIRSYADALSKEPGLTVSDFLPNLFKSLEFRGINELLELFYSELEKGNCLFIFDGLDEVRELGLRINVGRKIQNFIDQFDSGNKFVITSRIAGYAESQLIGDFKHYCVSDFDENDIRLFVEKWCQAFEETTNSGFVADEKARNEAQSLITEIWGNSEILKLASNPLLVTILALVHYQGMRLPPRRAELYELCVKTLAETWNLARNLSGIPLKAWLGNAPLDERYVTRVMGPVSLWMRERKDGIIAKKELEVKISEQLVIIEGLAKNLADETAADFLGLIVVHCGLMVEVSPGMFSFLHPTFEEYLAAKTLTGKRDVVEIVLNRLNDPRWRETILLTAALLNGDYADELVKRIKEKEDYFEPYIHRNLLTASWCLVDDSPISNSLRKDLLGNLYSILLNFNTPIPLTEEIVTILGALKGSRCEEEVVTLLLSEFKTANDNAKNCIIKTLGNLKNERTKGFLLDALKDKSLEIRQSAIQAIGKFGDESFVQPLIKEFKENSEFEGFHIAITMSRFKNEQAYNFLLDKLGKADDLTNLGISIALSSYNSNQVLDPLLDKLKDNNTKVKQNAAEALGRLNDERSIKPLIQSLNSKNDFELSCISFEALSHYRKPEVMEVLFERLEKNPEMIENDSTIFGLVNLKDQRSVNFLIEAFTEAPDYRDLILFGFEQIKDERIRKFMIEKLNNESPEEVKLQLIPVLATFKEKGVLEILIKLINGHSEKVKISAIHALGLLGDEKAIKYLLRLLDNPSEKISEVAAISLGRLGDRRAVQTLIKILSNEKQEQKVIQALDVLGDLREGRAVESIIKLLKSKNPQIRKTAFDSLKKISLGLPC